MDRKKGKKEIAVCLCTGILTIFIYCIIVHIWNMDLSIPLAYSGDLAGLLINIKAVIRDESWWNFSGLSAPFHTNMWRQLMDGYIPNAIIFSIAKVTQNVGYGINLYYILSYGLCSMCAYYMLRKAGVEQKYSVVGANIYALIPGHFQRNIGHVFIGSCFAIPLVIVTAMNLYEGKMCKDEYSLEEKISIKKLLKSNSREQYLGMFFLIIVSFCSMYYGIFALMLLTFCAVYCFLTQKKWRHLYYYLQYVFVEIFCIVLIYIPSMLAYVFDPCIKEVNVITRNLGDVEYYGGKLIQYILPVIGHRISWLSDLRNLYDTSFPLNNENGWSSLGLVMSIGFLAGILVCFFHKEKLSIQLEMYGKLELFLFLISTVGGLGAIVGLINSSLRCYNRFSFYIGAVGIIISMKLLQKLCTWIVAGINRIHIKTMIPYVLCLLVLVIGIFDQTTTGMVYTKEYGKLIEDQYNNDMKFVNDIETHEGENANILVFPVMNAQQSATAYTKKGCFTNYNEQMLFVQSNTSNWSTGSKAGEIGERWLDWLLGFDGKMQIEIAAVMGFSGVAIYYEGYETEQLNVQLANIEELLGPPIVINDSGLWAYYSISDVRDKLLANYTDEEISTLKEKYLNKSWCLYNSENLYTTSKYSDSKIILMKDTWQYGPYVSFDAGLYTVEVYGENLENAVLDCVADDVSFNINIIKCSNDYVKYQVYFDVDVENLEFRAFNELDTEVMVEKIEVSRVSK